VDAGANHGLYTCTLGVLPGVTCIAIEPDAGNFLELQTNMALNPAVKAKLANVCVARERALLELEDIDPANSGKIRVVVDKAPNGCPRHTVAAVSLQELLTDAAVSQVTLLKVDVEGYELPVLEGLDWNSNLRPEHILIEYSDYVARAGGDQGKESLIRFFEQRGYQGFTIRGEPLGTAECVPESNAWFKDARPR
jgi:FkbM family methyltransferase